MISLNPAFFYIYSGMPISRTSKGNENWLQKSAVRDIGGKITVKQIQGNRLLVRVVGVFEKRGFEKSGFNCTDIYCILLSSDK